MQNLINIAGKQVPLVAPTLSNEQIQKVKESKKFEKFLTTFSKEVDVEQVNILSVYWFGNNVGFINLDVETYSNGKRLPGYVFLRGDAVAILLIVNGMLLLTKQFRVPVGQFTIEAPAGMVDESSNFAGVAAKELKEECGIEIHQDEMKYLQDVFISPGGSDEVIHLFCVEKQIPQVKLEELLSKIHGAEGEGEQIHLQVKEFNWKNVLATKDIKLISAAAAYWAKL